MAGEMIQDIDEVLALKASAKSARDRRNWRAAIGDLEEALGLLQEHLPSDPAPTPSWLAAELADTYGIVGGVQRRWGLSLSPIDPDRQRHLSDSADAYDKGFRYEERLGPNEASTYNRINRLVGRVLLDPQVLQAGGDPNLDGELQKAEEIVTEQLRSIRQRDPWAYCDLGTIRLLRGKADALDAFHALDRLRPRPPTFVYESTLATIEQLSDAAGSIRPTLADAVNLLRRSVRYSS
jgi:tetratricopeptide (TPR) repeat protein